MPARKLGDEKRRDRGTVAKRLVVKPWKARNHVHRIARRNDHLRVFRTKVRGNGPRVRCFVERVFLETDGESLHGPRRLGLHQCNDRGRVDAA